MWRIGLLLSILIFAIYAAPQAPPEEKYEPVLFVWCIHLHSFIKYSKRICEELNKFVVWLWFFFQFQFEYQYEVKDPEKMLFFDKNEIGDAQGKVHLHTNNSISFVNQMEMFGK